MSLIKNIINDYNKLKNDPENEKHHKFDPEYRENDPIFSILNYFLISAYNPRENREIYDADVRYYIECGLPEKEALFGDSMVSFWKPYSEALKEAGLQPSDGCHRYCKKVEHIEELLCKLEEKDDAYNKVNEKFINFAKLCHTKGNFILLPDRRMQNRGLWSEDRIDKTLFECLNQGRFINYFKKITFKEWIEKEKLNIPCLIENENIYPLDEKCIHSSYYEKSKEKTLDTFIKNTEELIKERNKLLKE